jgi:AraC family transcriptional regulator, transcriptional activator of pobA
MKLTLTDPNTGGDLLLIHGEPAIDRHVYTRDRKKKYFTIAWNRGDQQTIFIDGDEYVFMPDTIVPLMFDQTFSIENANDVVAWQFNREFYCIIDHDAEVSCVGFLFGAGDKIFIGIDDPAKMKFGSLLHLFITELQTKDTIQKEMLLALLKRLIIDITKLARSSYIPDPRLQGEKLDILRQFNLLVEANFCTEHSVSFYAQQLNKSPKTLSNLFPQYNQKTPLQIIQDRIITEARRLLSYTDKTVKQITYDLGFEDPAYFSNFFKRYTSLSPAEFRKNRQLHAERK